MKITFVFHVFKIFFVIANQREIAFMLDFRYFFKQRQHREEELSLHSISFINFKEKKINTEIKRKLTDWFRVAF